MAHFYGTLQGSRGEATRLGTKNSGIHTTTCSYQGKVRVVLDFDEKTGKDIARISLAKHMGSGVEFPIFEGPVGEAPAADALPAKIIAAAKPLIHYCETSPATSPGEGYWDDLDAAFGCGENAESYNAAAVIRQFLRKLGIDTPDLGGYALCPGCSKPASSGEHDPDCTLADKADAEDFDRAPISAAHPGRPA